MEKVTIDRSAIGWMVNTAKKQYWRVAGFYEFDDLIQDGYMVFYRVVERYPALRKKQIMARFKTSYINHIHKLSNRRTKHYRIVQHFTDEAPTFQPELATFQTLCGQASPPIKQFLDYMTKKDCMSLPSSYRVKPDGTRETVNERLCRLIGIDPKSYDLVSELKLHFK